MLRTKPPYPPEFRVEAVRLVLESGKKMAKWPGIWGYPQDVHQGSRGTYRAPRIHAALALNHDIHN